MFNKLGVFLNKCNVWRNVDYRNTVIEVSNDNTIYENNQPALASLAINEC